MDDVWEQLTDVARRGRLAWLEEARWAESTVEAQRRRGRSVTDVCREWMMAGHEVRAEWEDGEVSGRIVEVGDDLVVVDDGQSAWGIQPYLVSTWDRAETTTVPFAGVKMWPSWDAWVGFLEMEESAVTVHLDDGQTRRGDRVESGSDHLIVHHRDGSETIVCTERVVSVAVLDGDILTGL